MSVVSKLGLSLAVVVAASSIGANSAVASEQALKAIYKSLGHEVRSAEEVARDTERKPFETLDYFGLEPEMTVIELMPGGGWYTKVLANTLNEKGKLYVALGTGRVAEKLEEWQLSNVEVLAADSSLEKTKVRGIYKINNFNLGVDNVDMVLTFRNAHNISPDDRADLNAKVFAALKPGGVYGVVDHTRRHNAPLNTAVWRRLDPVVVIKEALDAGFEFDGFSDLHYQPDDTLSVDTRDESMTSPSDRFTLKFRKPS